MNESSHSLQGEPDVILMAQELPSLTETRSRSASVVELVAASVYATDLLTAEAFQHAPGWVEHATCKLAACAYLSVRMHRWCH